MDRVIISQELDFLLYSIIFGVFIGIYYDIFRFLREMGLNSKPAVIAEDLFFCLSISIPVFLFFCAVNRGNISPYSLIVMLLGAILYRCTIGRITVIIFKLILKPFRVMFKAIAKLWRKIHHRKKRSSKQKVKHAL